MKKKKLSVQFFPYASQWGTIVIPEYLSEEEQKEYILEHFNEVEFGEVNLDYKGTEFDIYDEE